MAQIDHLGAVNTEHNTAESIDGTGYLDKVYLTYEQVVRIFGEPDLADGLGKSRYEWRIATPAGIAALYDWKQNADPQQTGDYLYWCIGGRDSKAAEWVRFAIYGS